MNLDYQTPRPRRRLIDVNARVLPLRSLLVYCAVSILTLPFINRVWFGEIPVIALIQVPKTRFVGWLRTDVVMPVIRMLGLSRGSFSPDYLLARPYRAWCIALLLAAAIDYCLTLALAGGPGLSIY